MLTFSERVVTLVIWALTATGLFFSVRAAWRRRKERKHKRDS
ncbi:hypothetical protein [Geoalkalibacter halelectricus]